MQVIEYLIFGYVDCKIRAYLIPKAIRYDEKRHVCRQNMKRSTYNQSNNKID